MECPDVFCFDSELRYTYVRSERSRQMGLIPEDMVGRRYDDVLPAGFAGSLRPFLDRALDGKTSAFYAPVVWALNDVATFHSVFPLFDDADRVQGITILACDLCSDSRSKLRSIGFEPHPTYFRKPDAGQGV